MLAALSTAALVGSGLAAAPASAESVWLCKPGLANNPCETSEETTVQLGSGYSFIESPKPASNPPIDCFYVYPTVSSQFTQNANLEIGPEETQIAVDQASRFSQTCKVYAPIYPQLTLLAITTAGDVTAATVEKAYLGVLSAWQEYLAHYNHGRGVVLIGHSQGALFLAQLIKEQIDPNPALRKQLVSAMLMGGNVLVPKGKTVGGSFANVPACQSAGQIGCVLAYSSFLEEPPEGADFGRTNSPLLKESLTEEEASKLEVLCVNPALLVQGNNAGPLQRYESTSPFPGFLGTYFQAPKASTPWVSMPEQYSSQCKSENGASWLQLTDTGPPGDTRELIKETLGPLWGTHLEDINAALGNLVELTALQSKVYLGEKLQVASIAPASGSALGGTTVTIRGTGFLSGATVTIGSAATSVDVISESEITATTAATAAGSDEVVVSDENGTSKGGPSYTYYSTTPPTIVTGTASPVNSDSATLSATVNPNGSGVSQCEFEYGTTASYGSSAPCSSQPGLGTSPVSVSAPIARLASSTSYHFRLSATNPGGTSKSLDEIFKTAPGPHYFFDGTSTFARGLQGERAAVISWGTLSLTNISGGTGGKVTCHFVVAGWVENPGEGANGPAGIGETQSFDPYACESTACTAAAMGGGAATYASVAAEPAAYLSASSRGGSSTSLGWKSHLLTEKVGSSTIVRNETEGVRLDVECHVQTSATATEEPIFGTVTNERSEGSARPRSGPIQLSTTMLPAVEFDSLGAGSGELHGLPSSEAARTDTTEGALKILGYSEQEVVNMQVG